MGNSYFVPGCSSLRLGSKRRKNAAKGREGDATVFKSSEWVLMACEVEALEHVTRELHFPRQSFSFRRLTLSMQKILLPF